MRLRIARLTKAWLGSVVLAFALGGCGDDQGPANPGQSVLPLVERPWSLSATQDTSAGANATVHVGATPTAPTSSLTPTPVPSPTTDPPDPTPVVTPTSTGPAEPPDPPPEAELLEAEVVELTNVERASAGCPSVHADDRLAAAARGHSEDMRERDFFDHTNPDGDGPGERARAAGYDWWASENIAWGYRTAEAVVAGWMDSPGHRRNILNCDVTEIGVGVADSSRGPYWTQMFGRR